MIRSIILCALLLGVANAARQIPINPSPPPPGPTTDNVPGALVSIIAPGYSSATWSSVQSSALCASLVANYTNLYGKQYIQCAVNNVVDTAAHPSAAVQAQLYWADFVGSTSADKTSATQSRDLFVNTLAANPNNIQFLPGKIGNVNDTCNSAWTPGTGRDTSDIYSPIAGMPLAQCRIAQRGAAVEAQTATTCTINGVAVTTSNSLCFSTGTILGSTIGKYGIDNGKQCPAGATNITPVTAPTETQITVGAVTMTGPAGGTTLVAGTPQTYTISQGTTVAAALSAAAFSAGKSYVFLSDFSANPFSLDPANANTNGCTDNAVNAYLSRVPALVSTWSAVSNTGITLSVEVDWTKIGCAKAPAILNPNAKMAVTHAWSPYCDTNNDFYTQFLVGSATATGASAPVCPRCGTSASPQLFNYNGPNAGKLCRSATYTLAEGISGTPDTVQTNGIQGTSCVAVGVANLGVSDVNNAKPMMTPANTVAVPLNPIPGGLSVSQYAFPVGGLQGGVIPSGSVVDFQAGDAATTPTSTKFQQIAIDSEFNEPCSTPAVKSPVLNAFTSSGIVGNYYLGNDATLVKGAGTCNTQSLWWNGGTGTAAGQNGIASAGSTMADLPTTFSAPIIGPSPAPAPAPTPSPKPTPPTPSPVPPSPVSPICTYKGSYEITPLYGPCNKYYLASGTTSDCSYNYVNLRTKYQLGNKMARIRWAVATVAEKGLSTPTNVVAEARLSAKGSCTNRNLAAPSDPSKGLKVGGSSWKWQIVPYPGSDKCDEVNLISQNRITTTAFLEVPKSCNTFRYNATDGGRQRFKMIKV